MTTASFPTAPTAPSVPSARRPGPHHAAHHRRPAPPAHAAPRGRWGVASTDGGAEALLEALPVALAVTDSRGNVLEVNDACCRMFSTTRAALLACNVRDLCLPDDLPRLLELERGVLEGTLPRYRVEQRFVTAHGDVRRGLFSVSRGGPDRIVVQAVDVSYLSRDEAPTPERDAEPELAGPDAFLAALEAQLVRARHHGEPALALVLDLEDRPGAGQPADGPDADARHHALLSALRAVRGPLDVVARLDARRWALLRPHAVPVEAGDVAARIASALELASAVDVARGTTLRVPVGVVPVDAGSGDARAVLEEACDAADHAGVVPGRVVVAGGPSGTGRA